MNKILVALVLLAGPALAEPQIDPNQSSIQIDREGSRLNIGKTEQGRGVLQLQGPEGSVQLMGRSKGSWKNATLTRGPAGELILSDPNQGSIVMERGPQGKTRIQTRQGNFTVDNGLLLQLNEGQDLFSDQLKGR